MKTEKPTYIVMARGFGKKYRMMEEFIERIKHGMKIKIIYANGITEILETKEDVFDWLEGNRRDGKSKD